MIRLADEEIRAIRKKVIELDPRGFSADRELYMVSFGAEAQFKKMVEWLEDNASLEEYKDGRRWRKDGVLIDWEDWQALKEEKK